MAKYEEREITGPVDECDAQGNLNPAAKGWSRHPLHNCNLKGRWPRKKKWNYWNILDDNFTFSATLANVDFIGLAFLYLIDFKTKKLWEKTVVLPFGMGCKLGQKVEDDVVFDDDRRPGDRSDSCVSRGLS